MTSEHDGSAGAGARGPSPADAPANGRRLWVRAAVLVAVLAGGIVLLRWSPLADRLNPREIAGFVRSLGAPWWTPLVFVPLYAVATALGLPGTVPTLAGGAIYGVARGTLFNWLGANLGAVLALWVARHLGRGLVTRLLRGRAAELDARIGEHGFRTILYLRLVPLVPFNALNFAAGLSRITLRDYVLGSAIGMLPGTLVYTYFADALIMGTAGARREALVHFLVAAALLIGFTLLAERIRRRVSARPPR